MIDISNPANPVRISQVHTQSFAFGLQLVGKSAYIANLDAGLRVFDVSNSDNPVEVGGINSGGAYDVQVVGKHAFFGIWDWIGQSLAINVSDPTIPTNPVRVDGGAGIVDGMQVVGGGLLVLPESDRAKWAGKYAYVASGSDGLRTFEVRLGYPQTLTFHLPTKVAFLDLPLPPVGVTNSGLPLTFSLVKGPATVLNNRLILAGLGEVLLQADQAGDDFYLPASVQWTVRPNRRLGRRQNPRDRRLFHRTNGGWAQRRIDP